MLSSGEEPTAEGFFSILSNCSDGRPTALLKSSANIGRLSAEAHRQEALGSEGGDELRDELSA